MSLEKAFYYLFCNFYFVVLVITKSMWNSQIRSNFIKNTVYTVYMYVVNIRISLF